MSGTKQTDKLFQTILEHTEVEDTSTQELTEELHRLEASKGNPYALLEALPASPLNDNDIALLMQPLIPAGDSRLAAAINQLGNIDWVRNGQQWLSDDICPFCQTPIDARQLQQEITALLIPHGKLRWTSCGNFRRDINSGTINPNICGS